MQGKSDADVDAEMTAAMAELRAELGGSEDDSSEEATPEADSVESDPGADEESEEEESEEEEAEPLEAEGGEEARAEIAKLFAEGNLKEACAKLDIDPAIFKVNNRQFAAARKAETEARRAEAEAKASEAAAATKLQQSEALRTGAEKVYGPIVAGNKAYRVEKDMAKSRAAVELLFEDKWENIKAQLDKGATPLTPAELRVIELEQRLEAEKTTKATADAAAAEAAQHAKDVAAVAGRLASTPLDGVEGAAEEIVRVVRASYNPALKKNTVTLKEAYATVKARYAKQAAQLSKLNGKPAAKKDEEEDEPASKPRRGAPARKPLAGGKPPAGRVLTEEERIDAEMPAARKEFDAQQRRSARRGK